MTPATAKRASELRSWPSEVMEKLSPKEEEVESLEKASSVPVEISTVEP